MSEAKHKKQKILIWLGVAIVAVALAVFGARAWKTYKNFDQIKAEIKSQLILSGEVDPRPKMDCVSKFETKINDRALREIFCNCFALNIVKVVGAKESMISAFAKAQAVHDLCMEIAPTKGAKK